MHEVAVSLPPGHPSTVAVFAKMGPVQWVTLHNI